MQNQLEEYDLPICQDIQLIAFDIDGTFLDDSGMVPKRNSYAIKWIRQHHPNLPLIICTAKNLEPVKHIRKQLNLEKFACCNLNGAYIVDKGSHVYRKDHFNTQQVLQIWDEMQNLRDAIKVYLLDEDYAYSLNSIDGDLHWLGFLSAYGQKARLDLSEREVLDKIQNDQIDCFIIGLVGPEELLNDFKDKIFAKYPNVYQGNKELPINIEFTLKSLSKGSALRIMLDELYTNVDRKNVLCFGDGENDISMFKVAGYSFAMKNTMPMAKEAATRVTFSDNNQGGLGEILEKIYHIPLPS